MRLVDRTLDEAERFGWPRSQLRGERLGVREHLVVWQDAAGKTWISYNEPRWIVQRHGIADARD